MAAKKAYTLELTGELTVRQTGEVCRQLQAVIADHDTINVDGVGISEIDIGVVQLLVASFKSAVSAGKSFSVTFPANGPLDLVLRRAGFISSQGDPLTPENALWARATG